MGKYVTDGVHLYELVGPRTDENFGLSHGTLDYWLVIDCINDEIRPVAALNAARFELVGVTSL